MNIEKHYKRLNESIEVINECISRDIVKRQRTIGFHCSAGSVDMLEIYLHDNNFIDPGFNIKHEWLKAKLKVIEKFPFEFENKNIIIELMEKIEEKRTSLCYGSPKKEDDVKDVIMKFNKLKRLFKTMGVKIE